MFNRPRSYAPTLALLAILGGSVVTTAAVAQEQAGTQAPADDAPQPLSEDELEVLVARIALYPDELVALVTSASLYPLQIVEAQRFLEDRKTKTDLKPKDSWDGSIVSLLNYPEIVKMMSDDLDWTQSLGDALAYQQKDVLIAIQQLRDKAVADGVIKSDDKVVVKQENDNVVIQAANPEKIYVPQYEPQMLYDPGYQPAPIAYYPEPYPSYYYPTATFFAGVVTGAAFAAVVDWDDWGVWGGRWNGNDIDIDCNNCFNNINGKVKFNDVDWKNVDRSKISFDKNQFNKIDRTSMEKDFRSVKGNNLSNRAKTVRTDQIGSATSRRAASRVSVDDVRKSKVDARQRENIGRGDAANLGDRKPGNQIKQRPAGDKIGNARPAGTIDRPVAKPKPGGKIERGGGGKPSALGQVQSGRVTKVQSDRGRQALGGGHRGGGQPHREIHRGGGGRHR